MFDTVCRRARVAELADAGGLNPPDPQGLCGFETHPGHKKGSTARVALWCFVYAVAWVRISTTVDQRLLEEARRRRSTASDAELIDDTLSALIARDGSVEIDAAYASAFVAHPLDEKDEWGGLASFRKAVS